MEEGVSRGEDPEDHGIRRRGRCDLARAGLAEEEDDAGPVVSECGNEGEVRAPDGEGFRARARAGPLWATAEGERDGPRAGHCWLRPFDTQENKGKTIIIFI